MKPIFATLAFATAIALATTASSQLLQPKAAPKAATPAPKAAASGAAAVPKVIGVGTYSCSTWLTNRALKNADDAATEMWVAGFLTAFNHTGLEPSKDITNSNPIGPMANAMDQVCRSQPTITVDQAIWEGLLNLIQTKGYNPATLGAVPPLPRTAGR